MIDRERFQCASNRNPTHKLWSKPAIKSLGCGAGHPQTHRQLFERAREDKQNVLVEKSLRESPFLPFNGTSASSMSLRKRPVAPVLTVPLINPRGHILSTSSMWTTPKGAASLSTSCNWWITSSTSRPTNPVAEKVVASAFTYGASTTRASALHNCVFPVPVGPTSRMFFLCPSLRSIRLFYTPPRVVEVLAEGHGQGFFGVVLADDHRI